MKIGIDIDGVLTNFNQYAINKGTEYCKKNKVGKLINSNTLSASKMFGWSYYHELKFWITHIFDYAENNPLMEDAADVIKKLKEEGHEIYIITSRWLASSRNIKSIFPEMFLKKKMRNTVKKWLQKNEVIYNDIVFIKKDKSKYIMDNNIDIMIEDNPKNIERISRITKVICYHYGYNVDVKGKNIYRCHNWKEIYNQIQKISYLFNFY